jgi:asparagine synthase (glutamine-hydrolysing)
VAITGIEVEAALPAVAHAMDQPTDDGVNSWIVSKAAHEAGLVVALSGVGGDELFGGYRSFATVPRTASIGAALRPVPRSLRRLAADRLVARRPGAPMSRILMASPGIGAAYRTVRGLFGLKDLDRMGALRWIGEMDAIRLFTPHDPEGVGPRDAVALLEMERYMRNQLLRDTDTMSMSHSLEVRVPLLDDRVLDLALTLPSVVRNRSGKALLQQAAGFRRAGPKQGFTLPFDVWMRGPLHDVLRGSLLSESMPLSWLVTSQARRAIWEAFEGGRVHWSRPWALGMLRLWADAHDLRW